ncbi:26S proteasome non-ATPase regulatory subunit 10 [Tetrabaena socialis]|uniref:26S proteasome non-ATPase regulatory subunit 10 n=1 Tax=Tetrabaena socialis TaxID=47790 RepID=A0A2J7ZSN6_9CHLO|nr:26S proteasome non-ATPase regulatory subunit 10 [Tetrabaena socialis]|eukprot:PNH03282.1 26S proteasome non-ATPase regulatory subunit 10 [Tetrabaena socialis]
MGAKKKGPSLTPLFEACDCNDVDALLEMLKKDASQLLKAGAAIGAPCRQGDIPLHYACAQCHPEVIAALAKAGSPLALKDKDGETPMDVAGSRATKKLLEQLIARREASGQDTGRGRADGEEDDADDWEEVEEEALGAEELAALQLSEGKEAADKEAAAGKKKADKKGGKKK